MPLALQAAFGFLQAIHYSAKAAAANRECCCSLSRTVSKVRPLLEEVEFWLQDGGTTDHEAALESVATALEKAHVVVVRFSMMGNLQAILETEAMVCQFCTVCAELQDALISLRDAGAVAALEWKEDVNRICEYLHSMSFESCSESRNTMKQVRQEVLGMQGQRIVPKSCYSHICSLLWRCQLPEKLDMTLELQGLRRELSRAKAEKDIAEQFLLQQVIRALQSSAAIPFIPTAPAPQPPVEYCCPISHQVMRDPVVLVETGQTYDHKCIEKWFARGNTTCPITGQKLKSTRLTPNLALKSLASTWVDVHGSEEAWAEDEGEAGADAESDDVKAVLAETKEKLCDGESVCFSTDNGSKIQKVQEMPQKQGKGRIVTDDTEDGGVIVQQIKAKGQCKSNRNGIDKPADVYIGKGSNLETEGQANLSVPESNDAGWDVEIPSKHTGLLDRIGNLLDRLKERRGEQPGLEARNDDPRSLQMPGTPGKMGNLNLDARFGTRLNVRMRPDLVTSLSLPKSEVGTSYPAVRLGSQVTESDSEVAGALPELSGSAALGFKAREIRTLPEAQEVTTNSKPNWRPSSAASIQLPCPGKMLSCAASVSVSEIPLEACASKKQGFVLDNEPEKSISAAAAAAAAAEQLPNNEQACYEKQSITFLRKTLEQKARKLDAHCRRHSWSSGLHDVLSEFQQMGPSAVSAQGRLNLLKMALTASRQKVELLMPSICHQRIKSETHMQTSFLKPSYEHCTKDVLTAGKMPGQEKTAQLPILEPSGHGSHGIFSGENSKHESKSNRGKNGCSKNATGAVDPVAHWLELSTNKSDDALYDEESEASNSYSDCTDISKLLQCPFTKDLGDLGSIDLGASGVFDNTDWGGVISESDDSDTTSVCSPKPAGDEGVAPSECNLSLSSLTTVPSGGAQIVPIVNGDVLARKGKVSPSFVRSAVLGCAEVFLDGDTAQPSKGTIPFLLNLLGSGSVEVAMATAVELGVRAKKDPSVQKQLSESGVIPCLVQKLQSPKRECRISAARALALLGDSSTDLQLEIIAAGAVPLLSQLTRAGSRKTGEAAGWAMSCLTAARKASSVESTPDVSVPLLVEMLCNGRPEVQASAVLELNRTLACVFGSCEEVGCPSVVQSLVNLLSYEMPEVHQAAGNLLASLVSKNQAALQSLIETDGIVPQLLHIIQRAGDHGRTAAAQVLKTLAESSEKIQLRITESNGILTLVTLLKVGYPGSGGREAAAWMLGSLACQSSGAGDQLIEQGTASVLEGLVVDGEAQEQIAAAWALHQLQNTDDASSPTLSVPLIVRSLESGSREAKVVAAWELCHLASSNFWVQMELLQADAIKSLMALLQEREPEEGINAALTTLLRLCSDMEVIPKEICQQGGISILLGILKERAAADGKLVMKLLSLLVERCPVHQQEVLSAGTVPFLVKMLNECEGVCVTARDLLMKLVENELTAISLAVCKESVPVLLEIAKSQSEACSKEASVALLSRMVEINVESRQILLNHGGMPVMLDILNGDETYDLKTMAANAMTKLAATNQKVQGSLAGSGAFGALVQLLQSTSTRIRCREATRAAKVSQREEGGGNQEQLELTESRIMKGEREKNESVLSTVEENRPLFNSPIVHQTSAIAPQQHSADKALVAALHTIREAAHGHPSDGLEWKSRGLRQFVSSNSQDVPKQLPTSACDNGTSHVPGEKPSAASSTVNHTSEELEEGSAGEECPAISLLVKELRYGQANGREAAAAALKGLAVGNKAKRLELVNAGAVPLLVEILQSRSFH